MDSVYVKISILLSFLMLANCDRLETTRVSGGILHAKDWNPKESSILLVGEWEIFPSQFLTSESLGSKQKPESLFVNVPAVWNEVKKDGKELFPKGKGFATYRLRLMLPPDSPDLMLQIRDQGTSYSVYADGKLLQRTGKTGKSAEESIPFLGSSIVVLPGTTQELDVEISNFKHIYGGLWYAPKLGTEDNILKEHHANMAMEIATSSSVLVLAIYQIAAFLRSRKEKAPIYFAVFSLAGVLRFFLTGNRLFNSAFPEIPWEISYRLEYLSTYALCSGFLGYLAASFPKDFHPKTELYSIAIFSVFGFSAVFLPVEIYANLLIPYQFVIAGGGIYTLIGCIKSVLNRRPGSILVLAGVAFIILAGINDILVSHYILNSRYILAPALFLFIFSHSLEFSISFSRAMEAAKSASVELEGQVQLRTKQLTLAKEKAESEAKFRYDFLATMSHEIRTPLNGLLGTANLLSESTLNPEQKEYAEIIQVSGENLLHLVNQFLDLSKIENHRFSLEIIPFDPFAVLQKAARVVKARAEEKRIIVDISYPDHHPGIFLGDEGRIQQVLLNLLSNAIKFTGSGGKVSLGVRFFGQDQFSRILEFWVEDDGLGIPADKASSLFEPFVQGDSSVARKFGGSGLGLTISKKLVELMGGSIRFTSEPEKGSKFSFLIPFPQEDEKQEWEEEVKPPSPNFPRQNILLVEDQDFTRKVASEMLNRLGMTVTAVANGTDALACIESGKYNIILLDIDLPEITGTELAARIKETQKICPALVAWTAHALPGSEESFRSLGFDYYLKKPSLQKDWEKFLESYLQSSQGKTESS
ncbi:ATP-binding protein [Leptospira wolffii]|uniref:histidine kinase n=1 Tax=Leptospira wolffii TaxID=409998 RepID=A0ABV5BJL2_9LEPT